MTQAGNSWGENVITSNINDECKKKKKKKKKRRRRRKQCWTLDERSWLVQF
jgi:hypothetical protein